MMLERALRIGVVAIAVMASGWMAGSRALGQEADAKELIMGTWKLDTAKSSLKRGGAATRPIRPATWVFMPEGDGFRMNEYDGDSTSGKMTLSYAAKFDGKEYPHPGARDKSEMVTHWRLGPGMIVRLATVNGKQTEWVTWAVSTDGKVLTTTSWDPDAPELQNLRIFDREE